MPTAARRRYAIVGGADAARFAIDAGDRRAELRRGAELRGTRRCGADNVYDVTVQVSDGTAAPTRQAIAVTVTDVNDAPVITSDGGGAVGSR